MQNARRSSARKRSKPRQKREQKQNELFLYSKDSNTYERLTNFNENHCNLTEVYKLMQDYWGAEDLLAEGITKGSNTQCILAAMKGLGGSYSASK